MGVSKSELFTTEQNALAHLAKAFAHPARIAILQYLFKQQTCVCGEIVEAVGLAQPTISQHLKELKTMGLIKGTVEGTSVCYCIDAAVWTKMKDTMLQFLNQQIDEATNCC